MKKRPLPHPSGTLLPVLLLLLLHSPAEAQQVAQAAGPLLQGVVTDRMTGTGLTAGSVSLLTPDGTELLGVLTDPDGLYTIRAPGPGSYRLRAQGIGYHPLEAGPFTLQDGDTLAVDLELSPLPIPMDSILVSARRRSHPLRVGQQLVYGRLLDDYSGEPIPQGLVRLLRASGIAAATLSDDEGLFWLVSPMAGTYRLQGERMGYETSTGQEFHLMPGDTVGVDFYLSVDAVLMHPIVVRATARPWPNRYSLVGMESFLQRMTRFGASGFGTFLTRDAISAHDGRLTTPLMLMSTVMDVRALDEGGGVLLRQGCSPRYYLDGLEVVRTDPAHEPTPASPAYTPISPGVGPDLLYPPEALEAVEVYVSPAIPAEFSRGFPCGVVALWTRKPRDSMRPVTVWRTLLVGMGVLGLGLYLSF